MTSLVERLLSGEGDLFPDMGASMSPPTAVVDFSKVVPTTEYPLFKHDQPRIGAFAQASPDNMAKMLIFVVASIKIAWPVMDAYFEEMFDYLVKHGSVQYPDNDPPAWAPLAVGKRETISQIWHQRQTTYTGLMRAVERDMKQGDTGFIVYTNMLKVPGLGLPKAGFATQLLTGKYGCIDSVNLNLLKATPPTEITLPDNRGFKRATSSLGKFQDMAQHLSPDERNMLNYLHGLYRTSDMKTIQGYVDYLERLKAEGLDSEGLWNLWVSVIANKIQHWGGKPIDVVMPNQSAPARVHSYNAVPQKLALRSMDKMKPFNTQHGASVVSADHRRMITGESLKRFLNLFA